VWIIKAISTAFFTVVATVATLFHALFILPIVNLVRMLNGDSIGTTLTKSADDLANTFNFVLDQTEQTNKSMNEWYGKAMSGPTTTNTVEYLDDNGNVITKEEWDALSTAPELKKTRTTQTGPVSGPNLTGAEMPAQQRATSSTFAGMAGASNPIGGIVSTIGNLGTKIWDGFVTKVDQMATWFSTKGGQIWDGLVAKCNQLANWFGEKGAAIWDGFTARFFQFFNWFTERGAMIWDGLVAKCNQLANWFGEKGSAIWSGFTGAASSAVTKFTEWGQNIWSGFWNKAFNTDWSAAVSNFITFGQQVWSGFWNKAFGIDWGAACSNFVTFGQQVWSGFWNKAFGIDWGAACSNFVTFGQQVWSGFWNKAFGVDWGAALANLKTFGSQIWNGFWNGAFVKDWGTALANFGSFGLAIWNGFKRASGASGATSVLNSVGDSLASTFGWHFGGDIKPLHFATGGNVPGFGFTDSVPAMLTPGERVLTQSQARQMDQGALGGITINLHIAPNADVSESAIRRYLVPAVIDAIDRQSTTGKRFVNGRGVY
jgi:hypothetical protein